MMSHFVCVFDTNVFGIVRVTCAFLPLLRASKNPVIVDVASGLGSFAAVHDAGRIESKVQALAYCSSKSAVTMLTVQYAKAPTHGGKTSTPPTRPSRILNAGPQVCGRSASGTTRCSDGR